jgi:hypothetical protein
MASSAHLGLKGVAAPSRRPAHLHPIAGKHRPHMQKLFRHPSHKARLGRIIALYHRSSASYQIH